MHVADLCVTRSRTAHLTFTCEVRIRIVQRILERLRMVGVVCYLVDDSCMFVCGFDGITMLFSDTLVSDVCSENNGVMLLKS
jgi:hypothetical protein